jgi:hypothetical protein
MDITCRSQSLTDGNMITILSIEGGGVREIIPTTCFFFFFLFTWALLLGSEAQSCSDTMLVFIHMRYERYSIYYYNNECSIYREHKVTIHERMRPLNNQ